MSSRWPPLFDRRRSALLLAALTLGGCAGARQWDEVPRTPAGPAPTAPIARQPAAAHRPPEVSAATAAPLAVGRADCVRLALQSNREFRQRHLAMEQARLQSTVARSQVYAPRLEASYTVGKDQADAGTGRAGVTVPLFGFEVQPYLAAGYTQAGDPLTGRDQYTTSAGVAVSRMLFNLAEHLRQRRPIEQADKSLYVAANQVVLAGRRLELETTRAFFTVQSAELRLGVRTRRVSDAEEFLAAVRENVRLGFKPPVEEANAEISLNQSRSEQLDDATAAQTARETLLDLIAQPLDRPLQLILNDIVASEVPTPDLDADLARTRTNHEDLGNQLAEIDLAIDQLRIDRDQLNPQVKATLLAEQTNRAEQVATPTNGSETRIAMAFTYTTPLDGWASERAVVAQQQRTIEAQTLQLRSAEVRLEADLRRAHRRTEALRRGVGLADARLNAERRKLEATLVRYQAGGVDNLEVTRAKQATDSAEIAAVQARIDLYLAGAEYRSILPAPVTSAP